MHSLIHKETDPHVLRFRRYPPWLKRLLLKIFPDMYNYADPDAATHPFKFGRDYYTSILLTQMVLALYVFFFYSSMTETNVLLSFPMDGDRVVRVRELRVFRHHPNGNGGVDLPHRDRDRAGANHERETHAVREVLHAHRVHDRHPHLLLHLRAHPHADALPSQRLSRLLLSHLSCVSHLLGAADSARVLAIRWCDGRSYPTKDQYIQKVVKMDYSSKPYIINMVYRMIPFLYELNCLIDWAVTETSCDIWNYMRVEEIRNTMFIGKYKVGPSPSPHF